jgi:hypothetical protein
MFARRNRSVLSAPSAQQEFLMRFQEIATFTLTVGLAAYSQGQTPPANRPIQPGPVPYNTVHPPLYRMNDVAQTMNLTPQQITQLNQLTDKTQITFRDRYNQVGTLPEAERAARIQELNGQYRSEWTNGARGIFNDNQLSRYQQLHYQYGGFNTLNDPTVQRRLNLTPEQRTALNENLNWSAQQQASLDRLTGVERENAYRTYQTDQQRRFSQYLTPEQLRTWREITGEPYTFQPILPGPGR